MTATFHAVFDGHVFRPDQPIVLEPNTRVVITIEAAEKPEDGRRSFLRTARSLHLQGPEDWSENLDDHLYNSTDGVDDEPDIP
jgi:hypothetical protein